jgi:hypothetical protein
MGVYGNFARTVEWPAGFVAEIGRVNRIFGKVHAQTELGNDGTLQIVIHAAFRQGQHAAGERILVGDSLSAATVLGIGAALFFAPTQR